MKKSHFTQLGWTVSLLFVVLYFVCIGWSYLLTDPALKTLHAQLLAISFPGFTWLTLGSFLWGLLLSFVYGWAGAGAYVSIKGICCKGKDACCK